MEEEKPRFEEITDSSDPVPVPQIKDSSIPEPAPIPKEGDGGQKKESIFFKNRPAPKGEGSSLPETAEISSTLGDGSSSAREGAPDSPASSQEPLLSEGQKAPEPRSSPPIPNITSSGSQPTIVINPNPLPHPENRFSLKPDIFAEEEDSVDDEEKDQKPWLQIGGILLAIGIAVVALLISMNVIPYKASVDGRNLEPSSVGSNAIADGSISSSSLDSSLLEEIEKGGPQGPAGERGPRGAVGARGPAGIVALQSVSETATGDFSPVTLVSSCPGENIAISGGVTIRGAEGAAMITESEPVEDFSGWRGGASPSGEGAGSWSLRVWAVCAKPSSALSKALE